MVEVDVADKKALIFSKVCVWTLFWWRLSNLKIVTIMWKIFVLWCKQKESWITWGVFIVRFILGKRKAWYGYVQL